MSDTGDGRRGGQLGAAQSWAAAGLVVLGGGGGGGGVVARLCTAWWAAETAVVPNPDARPADRRRPASLPPSPAACCPTRAACCCSSFSSTGSASGSPKSSKARHTRATWRTPAAAVDDNPGAGASLWLPHPRRPRPPAPPATSGYCLPACGTSATPLAAAGIPPSWHKTFGAYRDRVQGPHRGCRMVAEGRGHMTQRPVRRACAAAAAARTRGGQGAYTALVVHSTLHPSLLLLLALSRSPLIALAAAGAGVIRPSPAGKGAGREGQADQNWCGAGEGRVSGAAAQRGSSD